MVIRWTNWSIQVAHWSTATVYEAKTNIVYHIANYVYRKQKRVPHALCREHVRRGHWQSFGNLNCMFITLGLLKQRKGLREGKELTQTPCLRRSLSICQQSTAPHLWSGQLKKRRNKHCIVSHHASTWRYSNNMVIRGDNILLVSHLLLIWTFFMTLPLLFVALTLMGMASPW